MEGLNVDRKSIMVILGILAVVVIGSFLMSRGGTAEDDLNNNTDDEIGTTDDRENFADESTVGMGRVVIAESIDRDSCPVDSTSTLDADTDQFYVVAQDTDFPAGSDFFVRLYRDGTAVEDSPMVAAEDDYEDICIYAVFQSNGSFERGDYEAEFIINGNPAESVEFSVR